MSDNHSQDKPHKEPDWRQTDRVDGIWWGSAFIWGAVVMFATNGGWARSWNWWDGWGVFFVGLGIMALFAAIYRLQSPRYRSKWVFSLVFGVIFLAIGMSAWEAAWWFWMLVLLAVGAVTLRSAIHRTP